MVGDEITVTASIRNTRDHLVVTNVKMIPPSAFAEIIPDAKQILFLEGNARRDAKWRARIAASGEPRLGVGAEAISEGRPMSGPRPDIPAAEKAALLQNGPVPGKHPAGLSTMPSSSPSSIPQAPLRAVSTGR
jgi:hypothetical protein